MMTVSEQALLWKALKSSDVMKTSKTKTWWSNIETSKNVLEKKITSRSKQFWLYYYRQLLKMKKTNKKRNNILDVLCRYPDLLVWYCRYLTSRIHFVLGNYFWNYTSDSVIVWTLKNSRPKGLKTRCSKAKTKRPWNRALDGLEKSSHHCMKVLYISAQG